MILDFIVPGPVRGKGSVRVAGGRAYKDARTENYMALVAMAARQALGSRPALIGPYSVVIEVVAARPKRLIPNPKSKKPQPPSGSLWAPAKPDADNVAKAILDALVQSGAITDDCAVVSLDVGKWYVAIGEPEGVRVKVEELTYDVWPPRAALEQR